MLEILDRVFAAKLAMVMRDFHDLAGYLKWPLLCKLDLASFRGTGFLLRLDLRDTLPFHFKLLESDFEWPFSLFL